MRPDQGHVARYKKAFLMCEIKVLSHLLVVEDIIQAPGTNTLIGCRQVDLIGRLWFDTGMVQTLKIQLIRYQYLLPCAVVIVVTVVLVLPARDMHLAADENRHHGYTD